MNSLRLCAPAKLNLFLHIVGRRPDGYHELQTLFQLLDYGDTLTFSRRDDSDIRLTPTLAGVPDDSNLVVRAARALQQATGTFQGADIHLEKRLPMGGGIGGGSSDAATTLLGLNALWRTDLSLNALAAIGLRLGADVPVFVLGQTALAEGIGEQIFPVQTTERWFLVVKPPCSVATARVFSEPGLTRDTPRMKIAPALGGHWQTLRNDCEHIVRGLYPDIDEAIRILGKVVPHSRLTGTGACVFADFATEEEAKDVRSQLPSHWQGFIARGVDRSPTHLQLSEQVIRFTQ